MRTIHKEREALKQDGCKVPRYISLDRFRQAWIRYFGAPKNENDRHFLEMGLKAFWEDYLTGERQSLTAYFAQL